VHLEAASGRGTAAAGQVPDRHRGQQAANGQHRQWPPGRLSLEAQAVREVREDLLLQVADQREESVRDRGNRHPDDRRHYQQTGIAAGAQEGAGIRGRWHSRGHAPMIFVSP
jgi:hypothetical protein